MTDKKAGAWPWPTTEKYVTPYLPQEAHADMSAWTKSGRAAVHWVAPEHPNVACRNCQDHGVVYVGFLGFGPTRSPTGGKVTYLEAVDGMATGWYQLKEVKPYVCPHCQGRKPAPRLTEPKPAEVKAETEQLAYDLGGTRRDLE